MEWYNEAPHWRVEGGAIHVTTGPETDFWRTTHSGFIRDSGHFYFQPTQGDFTAEVRLSGQYRDLYDQAGLMVRLDERTWLKCGVEFVEGVQQASAVVTREFSDWSVAPLPQNPPSLWLRVKRRKETVEVYYAVDERVYTLLRQAYLSPVETLNVGLMCASPRGGGFTTIFEGFTVRAGS
jgi:regulation of enolase protein 1 (concanavalin A-like superfamily)